MQAETLRRALSISLATALVVLGLTGAASGGTPPKRLDRNLGWVLSHPHIHLVAWDNDWDAHNSSFPVLTLINFSKALASNGYFGPATEYGVGTPTYADYHSSSSLCGSRRPGSQVSSNAVLAWITCEVITPGTHIPYPAARAPVSNDVYVVMLPVSTTVSDNFTIPKFTVLGHTFGPWVLYTAQGCKTYDAYHSLSFGGTSLFTFAVLLAHCYASTADLTEAAAHELIEAAVDPIPTAGWIDDSIALAPPDFKRLMAGEIADICSSAGAVPSSPALKGSYSVVPYWSNAKGACVTGSLITFPVGPVKK